MAGPYQSGKNVIVSYKAQGALGSTASGAGGTGMRIRSSRGLALTSAGIKSGEIRRDGQTTLGRLGSQLCGAEYELELALATHDKILEAGMRGTWVASATSVIAATFTTIAVSGGNTLTAASGSFLTAGVKVGMMIKLTGTATSANNNKWIRVIGVTASTITVPAAAVTNGAADGTGSLVLPKYLLNGITERYWTVDEYLQDIDASRVGSDCKFASLGFGISPDNHILLRTRVIGRDLVPFSGASAPSLTSPTFTESQPLVLLDGSLRVAGTDRVDVTGFNLDWDCGGAGVPVCTSRISPDVFLKNGEGSGSISSVMDDLAEFTSYKAETGIDLFLLASENETDPKDFISIYAGNAAYRSHEAPIGADAAMIETLPLEFGIDTRGGQYALTSLLICSSAP
jgi:hypothetical protein